MPMLRFVMRRTVSVIIALWIIVTATFFLMHAVPGGPFAREKRLPENILRNIEARYKLDQPVPVQYVDYLKHLIKWDLGPSFAFESRTVNQMIADGFPVSASLGLVAISIAILTSFPAGVISALRQNRWQDNVAMFLSVIGIAVPSYVVSALLMYFLAYKLGWFPAALWGTPKHMVLPALALAAQPCAYLARLVRSSMLDVLSQDFIRTAKAKGLPGYIVLYKHAMKNAMIPVITYLGPQIAAVTTGSFVVEKIFAIPGIGRDYVYSIYNRDYTTIMG